MIDEQDERIAKILFVDDSEDIDAEGLDVSEENLEKYLQYLKDHIEFPCQVKSVGEFGWEEYYTFGPGNTKEYEKLKKIRPSYADRFILLNFEDEIDSDYGIMVKVQRVSDNKRFTLDLEKLEPTDKKSKNYQLINDYSVWFVNN